MLRLLLATLGLFSGYHGLLVLVPLWLAASDASQLAIGTVTGAFMLAAVAGHLLAPRVVERWSTRGPFVLVLLATAAAALAHLATAAAPPSVLLSAVRGGVYGIGAVVSATAVAHLAPPPRRARALATYGFAAALPGVIGSTAVVYLAEEAGFTAAFVTIAAISLAAVPLLALPAIPLAADGDAEQRVGTLQPGTVRLVAIFGGAAMAYGALLTFVPVHLASLGAAAYPFVLATASGLALFRWAGGVVVTRWESGITLGLGLGISGLAMVLLSTLPAAGAPLAGFAFGAGFGLSGTATHALLTTRTAWASLGRANAIFNVAWSGGMGLGAIAFGALATATGTLATYVVTALWHALLLALVALWLARPDRWDLRWTGRLG
jgi:predicted MFS family arabinose efflux permease